MTRMRRIAIIAAAILGTLLLLALAAPLLIDVERFKPRILTAISDGLGRPVTVDGDLSLSLLPRPRLSAAGLSIANAAGFADQPMVRVGRLDVEIALMPLLSGDLDVKRLVLRRPDILLEQAAGGANNWTLAPAERQADAAPDGAAAGIRIDRLRLIDGRLVYADHGSGTRRTIDGFDAGLSMGSLQGPYDLDAHFTLDGVAIGVKAAIGELAGGPAAINAEGQVADDLLTWRFDGSADLDAGSLSGTFGAAAANLARLGPVLAGADGAPAALPPRALALNGQVAAGDGHLALSGLTLRVGESVIAGLITVEDGDQLHIDADLDAARLDIADVTAQPASAEPLTGPFSLNLPGDVTVTLRLAIARLDGVGLPISNIGLSARLADGAVRIGGLQGQVPGGDFEGSGILSSQDGMAAFSGDIAANLPDLRALLQALEAGTADLPAQAYRQARLQGRLALAGERLTFDNLTGRLDGSAVTGRLVWHVRARPAYDMALTLDTLDLDRYAPPGQPEDAAAAKAAPPSLAPLADFDADLALRVTGLTRGDAALGPLALDAKLLQGVLTLRQARLGAAERIMAGVAGTVRDVAGTPKLDLNLEAAGAGLDRLFTMLAMPVPDAFQATGPFRLTGTAAGTLDGMALDLNGSIDDLAATVKGRVDDLQAPAPRFDLGIDARHPSLALLARQFGLADLPARDTASPLRLDAKLSGAGNTDLTAAGQILADGDDRIAFTLDRRPNALNASVDARAKDLVAFIHALGIDYQPMASDLGVLDVAVAVAGNDQALAVTTLRADIGGMTLSGTGQVALAGAVPDIRLTLRAGALDLDRLLPPAETGAEQAAEGGARWSDEPLALDWLRAADGQVSLSAESLVIRRYRFDQLRLALESRGPALEVTELSGKLFGGPATIRARLDAAALPQFTLGLDMADVPVDALLDAAAAIQPATGTLALTGQFSGQGASERAIVASLAGQGQLSAKNGVIRRVDLARINTKLESLSTVNDFIRLTGTALKGGETAYRHMGFAITAQQGKLQSRDFAADVDGADVDFTLAADLPAWTIDAVARMRLKSNAEAPPIGATIVGDLDNPVIAYQTKALEQWVGARLGAAVLKGVVRGEGVGLKDLLQKKPPSEETGADSGTDAANQLNGDAATGATEQPAPVPAPAKKPEEEIRDLLLEGLFGKKKKEAETETVPAPE